MPGVQAGDVRRGLSGDGRHPHVHQAHRGGRPRRSGARALRRQCPASGDRSGVSAGASVRGGVRQGSQGRAGGHRPPRALRRRLGPGPSARGTADVRAVRQARRHRRVRPGRPDRGGRAGPPRSRGHDLRGPARARWRAVVRHPGVPAAQRDRGARGAPSRSPRCPHRVQRGDRAHLHARRPARPLRCPVHLGRCGAARCSSASRAKD